MKRLAVALLAVPIVQATHAPSAPRAVNAAYADAARVVHPATFAYDGPCDGPGTTTVRLADTGTVLVARVTSRTIGNACGAGVDRMDCPPVPEAFAWTLRGDGVLLMGGGPGYYYAYADQPLAYVLAGRYLGGELAAWGVLQASFQ